MSRKLRLYVSGTGLVALGLLYTHLPPNLAQLWPHAIAWIVICLVSETMWITSRTGEATLSHAAAAGLSAIVLFGPIAGMWVAGASTLIADLFVQRKPWVRATFNASQITVTSWVAGLAFDVLGGRRAMPLVHGAAVLDRAASSQLVVPFVALVLAYFLFNRSMVALAVAWSSERRWWNVLREDWLYLARLEVDAASLMLVPLMVISFISVGYPGVLLFYAPLFMLFQADRRYFDLKRAEEENLRNARFVAKGELAARIGHDLGNVLTPIINRTQLLLRDVKLQKYDKVEYYAQSVLENAKRMNLQVKGLSDYTRSEVNVEPMDLNGLLLSTIELVKGEKKFAGVEWDVDLDAQLPELKADVGQIQNVFINLFVNAADAMGMQESRRAIAVRTRADGGATQVRVDVTDTGPGIRPENLPRMFEFMFTTKADGHGFGLSTSHRTIQNHGGKISVESPEGSGAHFVIQLPLRRPGAWS
jgi:signal transduction histidine kinase